MFSCGRMKRPALPWPCHSSPYLIRLSERDSGEAITSLSTVWLFSSMKRNKDTVLPPSRMCQLADQIDHKDPMCPEYSKEAIISYFNASTNIFPKIYRFKIISLSVKSTRPSQEWLVGLPKNWWEISLPPKKRQRQNIQWNEPLNDKEKRKRNMPTQSSMSTENNLCRERCRVTRKQTETQLRTWNRARALHIALHFGEGLRKFCR